MQYYTQKSITLSAVITNVFCVSVLAFQLMLCVWHFTYFFSLLFFFFPQAQVLDFSKANEFVTICSFEIISLQQLTS